MTPAAHRRPVLLRSVWPWSVWPWSVWLWPVLTVCSAAVLLAGCSGGGSTSERAESPERERRATTDGSRTDGSGGDRAAIDLSGTAWRLVSIDDGDGEVDTSGSQVPAVVTFDGDGVEVYDGVNTASGEYRVAGGELAIELGSASEFETGDELPQYELIDLLPAAAALEVDAQALTIELDDGTSLRFELAVGVTPG